MDAERIKQVALAGLPAVTAGAALLWVGPLADLASASAMTFRIGIYLLAIGILHAFAVSYALAFTQLPPAGLARRGWWWIGIWHGWVALIVAVGALIGAVLFPLIGSLAGMDYTVAAMLRRGVFDGGFYALIWAPGAAFVICVVQSRRRGRAVT